MEQAYQQPAAHQAVLAIRLLKIDEVEKTVGLKKSKIYQLIQENRFPKPIRLGRRASRWNSAKIFAWVKQQIDQAEEI